MKLTIEDRIEIQDLLADYCFTLDSHDWLGLAQLFHDKAILDFSGIGGIKGNPEEVIEFLKAFSNNVHSWQHTTSTNKLKIENNIVISKTAAQVMTITKSNNNNENTAFFGLWYNDKIIKENKSWVITERILQPAWTHNVPA